LSATRITRRDGTLLDFDYREVRVARAIIENARRVILVADKLKLEWLMKSTAAEPITAPSARRTGPPATIRLIFGWR
jgi:hypothetical protein